jgi:hypothetical protein
MSPFPLWTWHTRGGQRFDSWPEGLGITKDIPLKSMLARPSSQRFTGMTTGVLPFSSYVDRSIHQVDNDSLLGWAISMQTKALGHIFSGTL